MDPEAQAGLLELRFDSLIDLLDMLLGATRKKFVNPIDVRVVLDALNWPRPEPIWCRPDLEVSWKSVVARVWGLRLRLGRLGFRL